MRVRFDSFSPTVTFRFPKDRGVVLLRKTEIDDSFTVQ